MKFKKHYEAELFISVYFPDTKGSDTLRPVTDQDLKDAGYVSLKEAEAIGRKKLSESYQEGKFDSIEDIEELKTALKDIYDLALKGYVMRPSCADHIDTSSKYFLEIRDIIDHLGISNTEPPR